MKFLQSLRFRLTIWNSLVVLLASALAMFAVREGMRLTFEQEARSLMREETTELELAVQELHGSMDQVVDEFERKIDSHRNHNWFASLDNEDQQVVWESDNFPESLRTRGTGRTAIQPFDFSRDADHLLVRHVVTVDSGKRFLITLGVPTRFIANDVWSLTKIMLWIGAVLFLIAPLGGYLLARRATQPVRLIIQTTRQLNPAQLDQRLPIRGTNDELDQISEEINLFVDQISRYLNSHRAFIADAAHELRSPLTAIQTSVEVTLNKDRTVDEYREELETVNEQCQQLRHLVNQLLDLAETDVAATQVDFQPVDLRKLIRNSIDFFAGVAEEKQISVVCRLDSGGVILGDETKLRQVVNNLLDNALKFTPPAGEVMVQLGGTVEELTLVVCDSGPGVPEAELTRIFDRFYQVDRSRNRDHRIGNGLGLSICKSIVQMHGGTIEGTNVQPRGFQVVVRFERKKTDRRP